MLVLIKMHAIILLLYFSVCVCVCVWESNSTLKSEFQNGEFEQVRISHRVTGCSGETCSNLGNVTGYPMVSVVILCSTSKDCGG